MPNTKLSLDVNLFKIPLTLSADVAKQTVFWGNTDFNKGEHSPELDRLLARVFRAVGIETFFKTDLHLDALHASFELEKRHLIATGNISLPNSTANLFIDYQTASDGTPQFAVGLDLNYDFDLGQLPILQNQLNEPFNLTFSFANFDGSIVLPQEGKTVNLKRGVSLKPNLKFPKDYLDFNYELQDFTPLPENPELNQSTQLIPIPKEKFTKWFEVNKLVGPVNFKKVGFQWKDKKVWVLLSLDFISNGLEFSLLGLKAGTSLNFKEFKPHFDLHGFGIHYKSTGIEFGGTLYKTQELPAYYLGKALFRMGQVSIGAVAGYGTTRQRESSMFALAAVNVPLGGTPFFFITGLAAGFGYNSTLDIPDVSRISDFPLLEVNRLSGKSPSEAIELLKDSVRPQSNSRWLAAGILFKSFELLDSKALLIYEFNKRQISLIGTSRLVLPESKAAYLNIQFGLKSTYRIDEGILKSDAQVSPSSYLIHPNVVIEGGVACYAWFKGEQAGDFVLSIGGYHPKFNKPAHYPSLPRVGFNWIVSETTQMQGSTYFALTSSAAMTGFEMQAMYEKGNLKAWFNANTDLLLQWKPFAYDFKTKIRLGATYNANLLVGTKNYKLDIGADLHLFGPPLGGYVDISWTIISFKIKFGNPEAANFLYILDWETFQQAFLPKNEADVTRSSISTGFQEEIEVAGEKVCIVRADEVSFSTQSVTPSNHLIVNGLSVELPTNNPIGIRPMNQRNLRATQSINFYKKEATTPLELEFTATPQVSNLPAALWSPVPLDRNNPKHEQVKTVTSVQGIRPKPVLSTGLPVMKLSYFNQSTKEHPLVLTDITDAIFNEPKIGETPIASIEKSIEKTSVKKKRSTLIQLTNDWLELSAVEQIPDEALTFTKQTAQKTFQSEPKLGSIQRIVTAAQAVIYPKITARAAVETVDSTKKKETKAPQLAFFTQGNRTMLQVKEATLQSKTTLKSRSADSPPPPPSDRLTLSAGMSCVFNIDDQPFVKNILNIKGKLPLQITQFNAIHQIVGYDLIEPSEVTQLELHSDTQHLVLRAVDPQQLKAGFQGWQSHEQFLKINQNTLSDDKLCIQFQVPFEDLETKTTSVQAMESKNRIRTAKTPKGEKGWIDTVAFDRYKTALVIATQVNKRKSKLSKAKKAVQLSIPYGLNQAFEKENHEMNFLKPSVVKNNNAGEVRMKFRLLKKYTSSDIFKAYALRLHCAEGWKIQGLVLFPDRVRMRHWLNSDFSDTLTDTPSALTVTAQIEQQEI